MCPRRRMPRWTHEATCSVFTSPRRQSKRYYFIRAICYCFRAWNRSLPRTICPRLSRDMGLIGNRTQPWCVRTPRMGMAGGANLLDTLRAAALSGRLRNPERYWPMTVGSRSIITARGTCRPLPVSEKNVENESSQPPIDLSEGIWPSGWIPENNSIKKTEKPDSLSKKESLYKSVPCSKQYNSQHAFPIWTPACPIWIEITSRCKIQGLFQLNPAGKPLQVELSVYECSLLRMLIGNSP